MNLNSKITTMKKTVLITAAVTAASIPTNNAQFVVTAPGVEVIRPLYLDTFECES